MADSLKIPFSSGCSVLISKKAMETSGGMENLGRYLAEDYYMAYNIKRT